MAKKRSQQFTLRQPLTLAAIAIAILAFAYIKGKSSAPDAPVFIPNNDDLTTVIIPDSIPSDMLEYTGFSMSFNPRLHIPNYVAWELTADETNGTYSRSNRFAPDENVPASADTYDYLYSGYDRGHMAPAGDMKWSAQAMDESFLLTNICPQKNELNVGAWRAVEEKCRKWARRDSSLIIIAGPVLNPAPHEFIGDNRVAVPRSFFKVILAPKARPIRAIAFHMPNQYIVGGMQATVTSVDNIEALTGLDFFSSLPDSIENQIEAQSSLPEWDNQRARKK